MRNKKTPHVAERKNNISPLLYLTATSGDDEGEIDLVWEPLKTADVYLIQKSTGSLKPTKWRFEDIVTESSYTVSKLKSGLNYWFRVAAVRSKTKGQWSNHVCKKAP
jgi:hypothetical protein